MTTGNLQQGNKFCIFDYYLDGEFLKWEEVTGQCPILTPGQDWVVNMEDGTQIKGEIVETQAVSEDERKVFLKS